MSIYIELEVQDKAPVVDDDGDLHAIADPLRAGKERAERAAQGEFVWTASFAARGQPPAMDFQDPAHEATAKRHAQVAPNVLTEIDE